MTSVIQKNILLYCINCYCRHIDITVHLSLTAIHLPELLSWQYHWPSDMKYPVKLKTMVWVAWNGTNITELGILHERSLCIELECQECPLARYEGAQLSFSIKFKREYYASGNLETETNHNYKVRRSKGFRCSSL